MVEWLTGMFSHLHCIALAGGKLIKRREIRAYKQEKSKRSGEK
jgi:hypothetical protein